MKKTIATSRKIKISLVIIILLVIFLIILTLLLPKDKAYKINLNDGIPVIEESNRVIIPGTTIEKKFFVENESSSRFDYKLYFDNIEGSLGEIVIATFYDGNKVILSGSINEITKYKTNKATGSLNPNERKYLKVVFTFPNEISNEYKNSTLMFDIKALAVWPR